MLATPDGKVLSAIDELTEALNRGVPGDGLDRALFLMTQLREALAHNGSASVLFPPGDAHLAKLYAALNVARNTFRAKLAGHTYYLAADILQSVAFAALRHDAQASSTPVPNPFETVAVEAKGAERPASGLAASPAISEKAAGEANRGENIDAGNDGLASSRASDGKLASTEPVGAEAIIPESAQAPTGKPLFSLWLNMVFGPKR